MIGAVNMLVDISERKAAEEEKVLLLRELAHRVNNTFAVILAVAQQTLRTAPSSKAFVEIFSGRLQALAQAHNLLLTKDWTGADLGELAKGQLAPFCLEGQERLRIEGPKVTLSPPQAIALGVCTSSVPTPRDMALCPTASAGSTSRGRSDRAGWFLPGPSVKVRRSYLLSAGGSAPSSFSAGFLTRPLIGASRPTAWSAPSIFRLPSCNPRTAAPLALTYKLT